MKIQSVEWKDGAVHRGVDASAAYDAICKLRESHGGTITDVDVVNAAKSKRSVLHKLFTWDDSEAARAFRLGQARSLIKSFTVRYEERPETAVKAFQVKRRASVHSKDDRTEYTTTADALSDGPTRDRMIAEAIRLAMQFRRRFQELHELSAVFEAIEAAVVAIGSESPD